MTRTSIKKKRLSLAIRETTYQKVQEIRQLDEELTSDTAAIVRAINAYHRWVTRKS